MFTFLAFLHLMWRDKWEDEWGIVLISMVCDLFLVAPLTAAYLS